MVKRRHQQAILVSVIALAAQGSLACELCTSISEYGSDTNTSIAEATSNTTEMTASVSEGFASIATNITTATNNITAAIEVSSATITAELERSSKIQTDYLEALRGSMETLARSEMTAETNRMAARTHGARNLPMDVCASFARAESREDAEALADTMLQEFRGQQIEERKEETRVTFDTPYMADAVPINANAFSEAEADLAIEQASALTGERSFQVSPDVIMALSATSGGSPESQQLMSAWLRTSAASRDVVSQITRRTVPDADEDGSEGGGANGGEGQPVEPVSVLGELWRDVGESVSLEGAKRDTGAGKATLLRSIGHRMAVGNRIKLAQLKEKLAVARMSASQIGYMNEEAMSELQSYIDQLEVDAVIERGETSDVE